MAVEAPKPITEHSLTQKAVEIHTDRFMHQVAGSFGISLGEDSVELKRVVWEGGRLIEDLNFRWSPYENSVLSLTAGNHCLTLRRQQVGLEKF